MVMRSPLADSIPRFNAAGRERAPFKSRWRKTGKRSRISSTIDEPCTVAHIDKNELELAEGLRGQTLQALAQTLRTLHCSHDDRDGGIQLIALLTGPWHRDDKFAVFLGDKIFGRIG